MANINLREYLNGVEELIESGQIEESLAHCRHILKIYPKHVDTYRMLGKAYLEAKRHGEASDIFQRVLSSSPDDFVAHIGMSIIREDESNQDAAIWHMERAFESQPSNRAVQDELRRLYGEREGFEPPKVRLTRGALARMYAHGDLYAQAISELRSALSEDPRRPDLQVLLARMYYLTNRKPDAIDTCTQILEKLPYCLYANHLMADILKEDEHPDQATAYLERVEELDPYAAQISTLDLAENVPADSVMVEHLVLSGAVPHTEAAPRAWTGALEPIDEPQNYAPEELPDWLSAGEDEMQEEAALGEDQAYLSDEPLEPAETPAEEEAGLSTPEPQLEQAAETDGQPEVPDWLRVLHPEEGEAAPLDEEVVSAKSDTQPMWVEEFDQAGFEPTPMPEEDDQEEEGVAEMATETSAGEDDDGLAWLEGLAAKQGAAEDELITEPDEREEDKPEWLKTPEEKAEEAADSLAWLDEMAAEVEAGAAEEATPEDPPLPQAQRATQPLAQDQVEEQASDSPSPAFHEDTESAGSDVPDWLRELGEEVTSAPETGELNQDAFDQPPDWLDELRPSTDELDSEDTEDAGEEAWGTETGEPDDLSKLDWLQELGEPEHTPDDGDEAAAGQAQADAWVPEQPFEETPEVTEAEEALPSDPAPAMETVQEEPKASKQAQNEARLQTARQALDAVNLDAAVEDYGRLARSRALLDEVIDDLESAVRRHERNSTLWQALGDAYMRSDRLQDALDCYTKAEDLL